MSQQVKILNYQRTSGMTTMEGKGFYYPSDVVFSPNRKMYVLNRSIEGRGGGRGMRVTMCDVNDEYYGDWGAFGKGPGEFMWPSAICVTPEGRILVSDEYLNKVIVFSDEGTYLEEWGEFGSTEGKLDSPSGLVLNDQEELFVSDTYNHRIQVFTLSGKFIRSFGGPESLNMPWRMSIGPDQNLYIADWGNDRVCVFSQQGEFLDSYGERGNGEGQFVRPADVTVDSQGRIYVCDWGNERVQVLGTDGRFLELTLGESDLSPWAHTYLTANSEEGEARSRANLHKENIPFSNPNDRHEISSHIEEYFCSPMSLTIGSDGNLYVTESNRHRIQVFGILTGVD